MTRGRESSNIHQLSLRFRCDSGFSVQFLAYLSFDTDELPLCSRPFHGDLQPPGACALHERQEQESVGHNMAGRRSFLTERAGLRRHHLHQRHGGCTVGREGSERYGMPQVLISAVSLRLSGAVCRSVVAGTGIIWAKSEGLYGVTRSLGSRHCQCADFRAPQRQFGMMHVILRTSQQCCQ